MAETIRERIEAEIEALDAYDYKSEAFIYANHVGAGNLITADEVQARIDYAVSEAVREERERCAKIVEEMPDTHRMDLSFGDFGRLDKIAATIRKEPDHD